MSVQLIPHPAGRSRNWYVDISVPAALQAVVGKARTRRSTGTADRVKALAEGARIEAELRAEWLAKIAAQEAAAAAGPTAGSAAQAPARPPRPEGSRLVDLQPPQEYDSPGKPTALSRSVIQRICAMRHADWEHTHRTDRAIKTGDEKKDRLAAKELAREAKSFSRRITRMAQTVIARGQAARAWARLEEQARDYAEDVGYLVAPDDPLLPDLVLAFAETELAAQRTISKILSGQAAQFEVPEASGALLSAVIPEYEAHKRGSIEKKSISKSVSVWKRLIAFAGDVPVGDVTAHDIYRFLEDRLHAKVKPWSQSYANGFVRQALREFFALARTQGHMHADNPMNHLETTPKISKEEEKARMKPRKPFTVAQVNTVFASGWYDPNAEHWTGGMATDLGMRYWGPTISQCHGFRVREMTQLVNSDFAFCDGILLVTIQVKLEDADAPSSDSTLQLPARKLKNESALRTLPVHPQLLALGFADFVRENQAQHPPGTPLFPSAIPEEDGEDPLWNRAYEQAFLRFVRDTLGFGHGYGNHSFRHLFEERLRDAQLINGTWPAGLGEFISGRRVPREADRNIFRQQSSAIDYGDGFIAQHVQRFVGQIDFEGVVFPLPYAELLAGRAS
ncbi:hypothetical protein F6X40_19705 [Paraburkholderia sp. UCT31]|uniref:DUF6538 domain-containing protein n=1 Tax=Paraburkholderia sp. UCT31 TaxID=2615209 RepID=UPI001655B7D4|nr:DUF6538 domain-containing protein [Paraburkholderia sp. UCT31]MBC8738985.1 hypothetical protein [Paraburkholderia sp. UCT31]